MPDPRRPLAQGETVETVFEVRVPGELPGTLRAILTTHFLHAVREIVGVAGFVVGWQETISAKEITEGVKEITSDEHPD